MSEEARAGDVERKMAAILATSGTRSDFARNPSVGNHVLCDWNEMFKINLSLITNLPDGHLKLNTYSASFIIWAVLMFIQLLPLENFII